MFPCYRSRSLGAYEGRERVSFQHDHQMLDVFILIEFSYFCRRDITGGQTCEQYLQAFGHGGGWAKSRDLFHRRLAKEKVKNIGDYSIFTGFWYGSRGAFLV